jgi:hypothetical protein
MEHIWGLEEHFEIHWQLILSEKKKIPASHWNGY